MLDRHFATAEELQVHMDLITQGADGIRQRALELLDGGVTFGQLAIMVRMACLDIYTELYGHFGPRVMRRDFSDFFGAIDRQRSNNAGNEWPLDAPETATPGLYFHGSPLTVLTHLSSPAERSGNKYDNCAIYFTKVRALAEGYAGPKGRVYEVELRTRNPVHTDNPDDTVYVMPGQAAAWLQEGHDAVINNDAWEVAVLDPSCIHYRDPGAGHAKGRETTGLNRADRRRKASAQRRNAHD